MVLEDIFMARLTKDQKRSIADGEWWQSLLPKGWQLYGWTYRNSASAFNPDRTRTVELNSELMIALREEGKNNVSG
jgi:hypothetical protein